MLSKSVTTHVLVHVAVTAVFEGHALLLMQG